MNQFTKKIAASAFLMSFNCAVGLAAATNTEKTFSEPTRLVSLRMSVNKTYKQKQANGAYLENSESVCDVSGKMPLFDLSQVASADQREEKSIGCDVQLSSGKKKLSVAGQVTLKKAVDLFKDGLKSDYKIFGYTVSVDSTRGDSKQFPFGFAMTDNLKSKLMVIRTYADNLVQYKSGAQITDERLEINLKFEDK